MTKPKQYTQGWVEFFKLKFKVTPDVLIPRPETELLVEEVLDFIKKLRSDPLKVKHWRDVYLKDRIYILDIGTGAGNIAISIARNTDNVYIDATDISKEALNIAQQNAKLYQVKDISFLQSDLLSVFSRNEPGRKMYNPDIIVANLPYIPTSRISYLDSSVKDFEPHVALDGGKDGFELYRKLFFQIKEKGWEPKMIIAEIDHTHGEIAQAEARKYFPQAQIEVKTDLNHKQRILRIDF